MAKLAQMAYGSKATPKAKSESPSLAEDAALGEAFDAYTEGDRSGFIEAMKAAIRACVASYGGK
jgi:hypothetical protein